jgi:HTH-type transcriptional regulator/antitoxin HigA
MELRIIRNKKQYETMLTWVDQQFDRKVKANSAEGDKLQIALMLIKQYEDVHYPIPKSDPIEAIKAKMQERGLRNKDLVGILGSKGYVSALLSKRKPLTLELARILHRKFDIPAEVFLK